MFDGEIVRGDLLFSSRIHPGIVWTQMTGGPSEESAKDAIVAGTIDRVRWSRFHRSNEMAATRNGFDSDDVTVLLCGSSQTHRGTAMPSGGGRIIRAGAAARYADDLTFLGDTYIALLLLRAVPQIIADAGFRPNPSKARIMPARGRQVVTGLTVNARVNIPRENYDRLKATIHHLSHPADPRRTGTTFLTSLLGQIAWVEQVHPHCETPSPMPLVNMACAHGHHSWQNP
jgi:hypothetical protein